MLNSFLSLTSGSSRATFYSHTCNKPHKAFAVVHSCKLLIRVGIALSSALLETTVVGQLTDACLLRVPELDHCLSQEIAVGTCPEQTN